MKINILCIFAVSFVGNIFGFCIDNGQIDSSVIRFVDHYNSIDLSPWFSPYHGNFGSGHVVTDPLKLLAVAKDTLAYMERNVARKTQLIAPKNFSKHYISMEQTKKTLEYLISIIEEDRQAETAYRILDSDFLKKNFECIKWSADVSNAQEQHDKHVNDHKIRLTQYAVFIIPGSYVKTAKYPCALYQLKSFYPHIPTFTKQQVLGGIYDTPEHQKKVKPFIWVSREGLEDALMQGSIFVKTPDEKMHGFKYFFSNGILYNPKLKNRKLQQRYSYFKPIPETLTHKFMERQNVVFAGNIFAMGVGKLLGISYTNRITQKKEFRIGILADTGGAFVKNLYQLDLYAGVFANKHTLNKALWQTPNTVDAYLLYRKA